jgi:hypothetical protein
MTRFFFLLFSSSFLHNVFSIKFVPVAVVDLLDGYGVFATQNNIAFYWHLKKHEYLAGYQQVHDYLVQIGMRVPEDSSKCNLM